MADRLTLIDPGERHVRIGAQFATNELEPIARSIDTFMERLDGFVEREQSFTATASHELRTHGHDIAAQWNCWKDKSDRSRAMHSPAFNAQCTR